MYGKKDVSGRSGGRPEGLFFVSARLTGRGRPYFEGERIQKMQYRSGQEIREAFIRFWQEKGSHHYPSFPLLPDDPSLLFTIE